MPALPARPSTCRVTRLDACRAARRARRSGARCRAPACRRCRRSTPACRASRRAPTAGCRCCRSRRCRACGRGSRGCRSADLSQTPACSAVSCSVSRRAIAMISAIASSTTQRVLENGALNTAMPVPRRRRRGRSGWCRCRRRRSPTRSGRGVEDAARSPGSWTGCRAGRRRRGPSISSSSSSAPGAGLDLDAGLAEDRRRERVQVLQQQRFHGSHCGRAGAGLRRTPRSVEQRALSRSARWCSTGGVAPRSCRVGACHREVVHVEGTTVRPAAGPGRIFISYRREETAYPAGWLYDRLAGGTARTRSSRT